MLKDKSTRVKPKVTQVKADLKKPASTKSETHDHKMKLISFFNNKGGVGKTTLAYHTAASIAESGKRVLIVDLDPQCNISLMGFSEEELSKVWEPEEPYIEDYKAERAKGKLKSMMSGNRSIHFYLKPTEDGVDESNFIPKIREIRKNLFMIPGRLSLHMFENKIASRWSDAFMGEPLALRTVSQIRDTIIKCSGIVKADYVLIDTSPSLGIMNKVIISTSDGFIVPCNPDLFSVYGLRNIGRSLDIWKKEFNVLKTLLSDAKKKALPPDLVKFLGYTIYNAKKYAGKNPLDLARADYNYAKKMPETITKYIPNETWANAALIPEIIGYKSVIHGHNTLPRMTQKYRTPIWEIPHLQTLESDDKRTIIGNQEIYFATKNAYKEFSDALLMRLS